jgi:DNA-binding transcriptional LysR family regulator
MVDWDDLRFLLAIESGGSATSAARKLGVDKATVARRVTRLEQSLGVRLLTRKASGWTPTTAGLRAASAAREIERRIATLGADFAGRHGAPRTTVSITAPHWFCTEVLFPVLGELTAQAPWMDLTAVATSRVLNLAQREADVALRNSRPDQGDFIARRAGELGSALYASRAYVRRARPPRNDEDWSDHRLVGYADRITYLPGFRWLEEKAGSAAGITRTDDAKALCAAIRAGSGVGVVPCFLGDREPDLVRFLPEVQRETIWLVSPSELAGTRAVKLTLGFVASLFKRNATELAG